MKKSVLSMLLLCFVLPVFSFDYRQVLFGNNYRNIHRIKDEQEASRILEEARGSGIDTFRDPISGSSGQSFSCDDVWVFKEEYGNGLIYRIVADWDSYSYDARLDEKDFCGETPASEYYKNRLVEFVFIKTDGKYVNLFSKSKFYDYKDGYDVDIDCTDYSAFDVISENGNIRGFLFYQNYDLQIFDSRNGNKRDRACYGWYLSFDHFTALDKSKSCIVGKDNHDIHIRASYALADVRRPFMYTVNNAFDGNPATSFVEDTSNDKISVELRFNGNSSPCKKLALINGFASSENLYNDNNRVKTIFDFSKDTDMECADSELGHQFFDWNHYSVYVTGIYRGKKFNDTCIAELNFMDESGNWVFGVNNPALKNMD